MSNTQNTATGERIGIGAARWSRRLLGGAGAVIGLIGTAFAIFSFFSGFVSFADWIRDLILHWKLVVYTIAKQLLVKLPFTVSDDAIPAIVGATFLMSLAIGTRLTSGKAGLPRRIWRNMAFVTLLALLIPISTVAGFELEKMGISRLFLIYPSSIPLLYFCFINPPSFIQSDIEEFGWSSVFPIFVIVSTYSILAIYDWWIIWAMFVSTLLVPFTLAIADPWIMTRRLIAAWIAASILVVIALLVDGVTLPQNVFA